MPVDHAWGLLSSVEVEVRGRGKATDPRSSILGSDTQEGNPRLRKEDKSVTKFITRSDGGNARKVLLLQGIGSHTEADGKEAGEMRDFD